MRRFGRSGWVKLVMVTRQPRPSDKRLGENDVEHTWTCSCCGRSFNSLPMDYAFAAPDNWFALSEAERATTRSKLDANLCVIDRNEYYVRGCLEIPISDSPETFVWGVWASVSEESFRYVLDHWTSPIGPDEPSAFRMAVQLDTRLSRTARNQVRGISQVKQSAPTNRLGADRIPAGGRATSGDHARTGQTNCRHPGPFRTRLIG